MRVRQVTSGGADRKHDVALDTALAVDEGAGADGDGVLG